MKKIMLAILLVLCVGVMTACSGNSGNTDAKASEYIFKKFELDKGKDIARCPFLNGNDFYYISYPDPDENDDAAWEELKENEYKGSVHRYKIDSGEDAVLFEIKNASDIESLYVTEQNQIKLLCRYYNGDAGVHALCTRTQDGAETGLVSLTDNVNAALDGGGTIEEAYLERDGQIYLSCVGLENGKKIIVRCDMEGNVTGSVKLDDYIEYIDGVFLDNEKRPAVEANSDEGLTYMYLDFEKGECGETVAIQDEENKYKFSSKIHGGGLWSKIYDGHGNAACYVRDIAGLCSYNAAEQKITYLFDWLNSGIVGNNVYDIMPLEDGRFLCECFDGIEMAYGIIEELKDGKKRKIIKCAILDTENDCGHTLQYDIIHYNNINADYKVELISYENSSNPIDAFAKDVIAGNVPDVLDISGVDVESYIRQGFFEDLAPYMENDGEFGRDYYVDGLYDAIAEDGKQYYAVKSFRLDTIAARASDTEKYKDGWTIYDLIDYYNAKPEGTLLYDYDTNREIFKRLAAPFVDDYIDRDTGHVSFDSDEFRALVEFCNSFPQSNELWSDYNDVKKMFSEGKILIDGTGITKDMHSYSYSKALFDGDVRFIGFPTADKRKAVIKPLPPSLAITTSSDEKDAAWDFVKSVITDDAAQVYDIADGIPSGKEPFEQLVKRLTATEKYTDEDGAIVEPLSGFGGTNEFEYAFTPFSEEEINRIRDMIKNAAVKTDNSVILSIVEAELNDYFDGRKNLDELINVLQDRVGKYVNENK